VNIPVVQLDHVSKSFRNMASPVLNCVDLQVQSGEIIALRGPSGSGKSTLLNIVGCLDVPSSGTYWLGGRDVSTLSREQQAWVRLHYIGFIFQSFNLIADHSVLENVTLPLYYAGIRRQEREQRAAELIERVGLTHRIDHRPAELSGGERQRVAIARAVACQPRLLLADEPTGALDSRTGAAVLELLLEIHAARALTLVLVTHDAEVASIADRQVFLKDGQVIQTEIRDAASA
jgi:ABC-type lipoprotein export system ATPase subunit